MPETLPILYRDEYLVAINKPSGLLVHRSAIDRHETRFAMQILRDQIGQHVFPVHRLDKPTSGVLLFALSSACAQKTGEIFAQHLVHKTYLAIVRGHAPENGVINHPLREERDDCSDRKMRADKPAQEAITAYQRLASIELDIAVDKYPQSRYSLVACHPRTGRKHQIRRHLKHINHPIIGDAKHGKGQHNRFFQQKFGAHRLLLAATELKLPHPYTGQPLNLCAPLDETFHRLLNAFAWYNAVPSPWLGDTYNAIG
jgi:tRNA pseudouridine65 synthase